MTNLNRITTWIIFVVLGSAILGTAAWANPNKTLPGSICQPVGSSGKAGLMTTATAVTNTSSQLIEVTCPLVLTEGDSAFNLWGSPGPWGNAGGSPPLGSCTLEVFDYTGLLIYQDFFYTNSLVDRWSDGQFGRGDAGGAFPGYSSVDFHCFLAPGDTIQGLSSG